MLGSRFLTVGLGDYRWVMGGGWNDTCLNGLELETSVQMHVRLNIDTDGYIWKYL